MTVLDTPSDFPLTGKEQAQWMLHHLAPGRGICNVGFAWRVDKMLRWWPLRQAFNHIVDRHPALRATVRAAGSALRKHISPVEDVEVPLAMHSCSAEDLEAFVTRLVGEPFDIERAPLVRVHLIAVPGGSAVCSVMHHLVSDAVTVQILARELVSLYDSYASGAEPAAELRDEISLHTGVPVATATVEYWKEHLKGLDSGLPALAGAKLAPPRPTFAGDRLGHTLGPRCAAAVERLRVRTRSTTSIVLLAAYYLLLSRHGAGRELVVGVVTNARRGAVESGAVGYHANTLPVRVRVDEDMTFAELVSLTRTAFLNGLQHGDVSFEELQRELPLRSADWRVPLFRHSFNFMPPAIRQMTIDGTVATPMDAFHGMSRLDLELGVVPEATGIGLIAVYSTEVHDRADIAMLLARYENLLLALDRSAEDPLRTVDLAVAADRELVRVVNDTARTWGPETLLDVITAQAARTPDRPAVDGMTYRRLLARAAGVRDALVAGGVRAGDVVGLSCRRGPGLAAAVLGVWSAGAAYLPLDRAHPTERAAYELDHAGVRMLIADGAVSAAWASGRRVVRLADVGEGQPTIPAEPSHLAYVTYTSGSTGRPKGDDVTHDNLVNVVRHFAELLDVRSGDRVLWMTTFSFDISLLELVVALAGGAGVVSVADDVRLDGEAVARLIEAEAVTVVQATPTTWRQLVPHLRDGLRGRRVLCGGEPLTAPLAEQLLAAGCRLFNVYGPTETTIWSTVAELRSPVPDRVPIGTPIANTEVFVLDPTGRTVPCGQPGELCIAGAGVAAGYRSAPALTAERFPTADGVGRYYRTGDQVRQRPDGQLEFLGRADRQVKVRGHRIELAEVESVLEELPELVAAAVFTEPDPAGHLRLAAAVRTAGGEVDLNRLRADAARRLPAAAVPSRFAVLTEFPLTGNDKIDYRALAKLVAAPDGEVPPLPAEPLPRMLVELWRQVLDDDRLSADTNFFLAGGHSLLAVELADRITDRTSIPVSFELIFEAPSPALLAERLAGGEVTR
ncbi:non-ribosomal peptide synthetase [Actinophytocola sp.]|uniref:non-ribosomal peptide synthetase n=1 Tax=Actinophytocola sp. TaxID=1872138 RepID=UPI00389AA67A